MVCLFDVEQKTINTFMWVFTILLTIGIILWFARDLNSGMRTRIHKAIPMACTAVGFLGAFFIGLGSKGKAKEGFAAIYGV